MLEQVKDLIVQNIPIAIGYEASKDCSILIKDQESGRLHTDKPK